MGDVVDNTEESSNGPGDDEGEGSDEPESLDTEFLLICLLEFDCGHERSKGTSLITESTDSKFLL